MGDGCHGWNEDQSRLIHDALHGRLTALRLLNHSDDVRQGGVLANLLGSHAELSLTWNGAGQHGVACLFHRRSRFAADHRFIYIGSIGSHETLCLGNHAIHRNLLAGSYLYHVAYLNGGNRNFLHLVVVGAFYLLVSH